MLKTLRSNWIALASSLTLLAAIGYILSQQQKLGEIVEVWRQIDQWYFALAVVVTLALQATAAWRLQAIMAFDGVQGLQFQSLFRIQLISQFVAHGAPISAIAELARAAMLKLHYHLTLARSIRLVLYERLCGAAGTFVFGLAASVVLLSISPPTPLIYGQLALWIAGLAGFGLLLAVGRMKADTGITLINRAVRAIDTLGQMLFRPWMAATLALVSLVHLLGMAAVFFILAKSMQLVVPWWHLVLTMPLIFFISSLPIFYQGWGGREATLILAMSDVGSMTPAQSVALSVAFGVVVFVASLPGAVLWMLRPSMRQAVKLEVGQA
jgi:hypothetical protein